MTRTLAVDFEGPITDGFRSVATFVPKLIGFLVILLVGYFITKIISKLVDKALERVGFDEAVEKGGIKKALAKSQYDASDIVATLVFYAIFIPVLSAAIGTLGIASLEAPLAAFIALIPKIIVAVVLVVVGAVVAGTVKKLIVNTLGGLSYGSILGNVAAGLVLLGFVKAALDEVGIATAVTTPVLVTVLATVGGILVVGVGGGLIKPMQSRLEDALRKASDEARTVRREASTPEPYPTSSSSTAAGTSTYPTTGVDPTLR